MLFPFHRHYFIEEVSNNWVRSYLIVKRIHEQLDVFLSSDVLFHLLSEIIDECKQIGTGAFTNPSA
jgi:hypothetical protein